MAHICRETCYFVHIHNINIVQLLHMHNTQFSPCWGRALTIRALAARLSLDLRIIQPFLCLFDPLKISKSQFFSSVLMQIIQEGQIEAISQQLGKAGCSFHIFLLQVICGQTSLYSKIYLLSHEHFVN